MCYFINNKVSYSNFLDAGPSLVDYPARVEKKMFVGKIAGRMKLVLHAVDSSVYQKSLEQLQLQYWLHISVHNNCLLEF